MFCYTAGLNMIDDLHIIAGRYWTWGIHCLFTWFKCFTIKCGL